MTKQNMFNFGKPKSTHPQLRYKIDKMHCVSCAANIDLTLEDLPGVIDANTNYATSSLVLSYDPEKLDPNQVINAIKELGYLATVSN